MPNAQNHAGQSQEPGSKENRCRQEADDRTDRQGDRHPQEPVKKKRVSPATKEIPGPASIVEQQRQRRHDQSDDLLVSQIADDLAQMVGT